MSVKGERTCIEPRAGAGLDLRPGSAGQVPGGKEKTCGISLRDLRESPGGNAAKDARRLIAASGRDSCARHLLRTLHEKAPERSRPRSGPAPQIHTGFVKPDPPFPVSFAVQPKTLTGSHVEDVDWKQVRSLAEVTSLARDHRNGPNPRLPQVAWLVGLHETPRPAPAHPTPNKELGKEEYNNHYSSNYIVLSVS